MLPIGIISIWSGSIATIPSGWALCNGLLGTPDLRDRFVPGAGGSFNPDDTGGSTLHTHSFTGDGHTHVIPSGPRIEVGTAFNDVTESSPSTGNTDAGTSLPPFFALAYIMRI